MAKDFDYNTERNKLVLREYGRNVQRMIEYTAAIEDKEKRNKMAQAIVDLMGQMNPHLRNVDEFKHKLWDHIYIISDGKLDVESPYPLPDLEKINEKPEHMGYPKHDIKFKHYGKNVERLIEKAVTFDDEEKRKAFTENIGNYMKLVYQNWNKENVNDNIIKQDIESLSEGKLSVDDDTNLDALAKSNHRKRSSSPRRKHNKGKGKGGGRRRKNRS